MKGHQMKRLLSYLTFAAFTFTVGFAANALVNYGGERLTCDVPKLVNATLLWQQPALTPPHVNSCGHFVVSLTDDRSLYLYQTQLGSLADPEALLQRLQEVFTVRAKYHVYRYDVDSFSSVPEDQRIEKTVYIKASPTVSYGEVAHLIKLLQGIGADPIGLFDLGQTNPKRNVVPVARGEVFPFGSRW